MNNSEKPPIYKEELDFVFMNRGSGVRRAVVVAALIEQQIISLAKMFLEGHGVKYDPEPRQEYDQSIGLLRANNVLTAEELKDLQKFLTERNRSVHNIFKGFTRTEWNEQNKRVIDFGRPIVKMLDEKLYP